jgi:hypothetical protein
MHTSLSACSPKTVLRIFLPGVAGSIFLLSSVRFRRIAVNERDRRGTRKPAGLLLGRSPLAGSHCHLQRPLSLPWAVACQ